MGFYTENGFFTRTENHLVQWVHVRKKGSDSKGVVFAPPLIGAGSSLAISNLRVLARKGYDLFSFNYSGHGKSSDKFHPGAALQDAGHALDFLIQRSGGKPVYAIASCYSSIPLIHAAHRHDEPIEKIVLVNAICHINLKAVASSFISYYKIAFSGKVSIGKIQIAFMRYMAFLFPGIPINRHLFGALLRHRTDVMRTVWEALAKDPLHNVRLKRTPVLGLYATQDRILKIYDENVGINYEKQILEKCPHTTFYPIPCDHFLSSAKNRKRAYNRILSFLD